MYNFLHNLFLWYDFLDDFFLEEIFQSHNTFKLFNLQTTG